MAIEVSDDTVWKAIFGTIAAGISFAVGVIWRGAGFEARLRAVEDKAVILERLLETEAAKAAETRDMARDTKTLLHRLLEEISEVKDMLKGKK